MVQWLGLGAFIAKSPGLIFGQGAKIPLNHKAQPKKKKKTSEQYKIPLFYKFSISFLSTTPFSLEYQDKAKNNLATFKPTERTAILNRFGAPPPFIFPEIKIKQSSLRFTTNMKFYKVSPKSLGKGRDDFFFTNGFLLSKRPETVIKAPLE